ncbi:MAG: hypothetical protein A3H97_20240 [Acidobacteria bacterium RIFCSPLOWO2_02_FULL_65_29]|nr:MAG: hypothetical protein A3H97_20240 [Acidobacteria bacterium RIFCSPLOWO2_02_FULL_65_29]
MAAGLTDRLWILRISCDYSTKHGADEENKLRKMLLTIGEVLSEFNMSRPFKHFSVAAMKGSAGVPALIVGLFLSLAACMFWTALVVMVWQFWTRLLWQGQ